MCRRSIFLGAAMIIGIILLGRLFVLPQPVIAFNPDNLLLQQETAGRPPSGITPE